MDVKTKTAKYEQIASTDPSSEDLYQPAVVDGRYVTPWGGERPPWYLVLRWALFEKNQRGIRGNLRNLFRFKTEELNHNLPVLSIDQSTVASPPSDSLQATWLGHASVLLQLDGFNILTDPCLNDFCGPIKFFSKKRYRPVPCTVEELPIIHAVCISHNHFDHLDLTTVQNINKRFGEFMHWYVPIGLRNWMLKCGCINVIELEWWKESMLHHNHDDSHSGVKIVFAPSQHWSRRGLTDENKSLWGSWCVIGSNQRFFFAGDTGYHDQVFKQIGSQYGPFDLAAIPIGAYKPRWFLEFQHVGPNEAVKIHQDVKSKMSLGIHWGTFPLGYEHYMAPPNDLKAALQANGLDESSFIVLKHGESRVIYHVMIPEGIGQILQSLKSTDV